MVEQFRSNVLGAAWLVALTALANAGAGEAAGAGFEWKDAAALTLEGKGWAETDSPYVRLPAKAKGVVTDSVWGLSRSSSGLAVRFCTDAPKVGVKWKLSSATLQMHHMPSTGASGVDLYARDEKGAWRWVGNRSPKGPENAGEFGVPSRKGKVECLLYLPLYNGVTLVEIGVPAGRTLEKGPPRTVEAARPIIFYGTSITQGACASRPGLAYAAILGRRLDRPTINLGFSGSGRMEVAMAKLLGEMDAAAYVVDCLWNMGSEMVAERTKPFVRALREARPDTPILLVEDSSFAGTCPTTKGKALKDMHQSLVAEGVKGLHFLSNQDLLGTDGEATVDGCHPNDIGMMRHADAFLPVLEAMIGAKGR